MHSTYGQPRSAVRWLALVSAMVTAGLYLNSSFYSAWVAGGPPTPYPEAWAHRALVHLCIATACLVGGIALFRAIGSFPRLGRSTVVMVVIVLLLLCLPSLRLFWLSDACLDSGGRWDGVVVRCEK